MQKIRDYAKNNGVSYEAVRKQVKRYEKELEGHIVKQGKTQYLDEYAVNFLDERRASNPVIILQADKDEEIEALKAENKRLLIQLAEVQNMLIAEKDAVKALQADKIALLEEKNRKKRWWWK